jgi:hypothetical protein
MKEVDYLLERYWDGLLPVRSDIIAHKLGLNIQEVGEDECLLPIGRVVYYKQGDNHSKIRFALAMGIAYHILGLQIKQEAANEFAANLLIPEFALRVMITRGRKTKIKDLALTFDVTESVMYWRLYTLGYFDKTII